VTFAGALPTIFGDSESRGLLRDTCRAFLDNEIAGPIVRQAMERSDGVPPEHWGRLAELGWTGMAVPERHGGLGFALEELAVLAEEHGRALQPGPLIGCSVFALAVAAHASDACRDDLLPRLADGTLIGTCSTDVDGTLGNLTVREAAGRLTVTGSRRLVPDGAGAHELLADATLDGRPVLVVLPLGQGGGTARTMSTLDLTRRYIEVRCHDVAIDRDRVLGGDGTRTRQHIVDASTALQCAESVGAAGRLLELTVAYARSRHQFGRPIGSFQAIKHRLADMRIALQASRAAVRYAVWTAANRRADASRAGHVAKLWTGEAASWIASEALQVHGGVGFTWEHDLHLYLRRIKANELLLGTPDWHAAQLGQWCLEVAAQPGATPESD
jgi:alkylation response protein AidB-like acyl-CoA dehydrogenase